MEYHKKMSLENEKSNFEKLIFQKDQEFKEIK